MTINESVLQRVADELAIRRTLARLSRAQDNGDREAYKTCFTGRVLLTKSVVIPDWQPRELPIDELADLYFAQVGKFKFAHHLVSNHVIDIDGDEATCLADLYCVFAEGDGEGLRSSSLGGRYDLKLRRVDGEWLISERSIVELYAIDSGDVARTLV
ncbi:nuclear transport factor 2 family protein [Amycolatopsis cynarae]|uniref:Nuclear transport factor 2 family protein n=1 Tax=Amycolatopsis cynarae TaxID=2995223 RepID=A0ABY7BCB0_9PSEU|nr:nuclear transport factor 2 family protein [Amycolatopsis sp. HUAS 11-8]WAL68773.1 nuclear transport factor 2 family protein [Amycolatopsis sp. HUAS 11-8]